MCCTCLDRLERGFPDPGEPGLHQPEPELLLAQAERRRATIARRGGDEDGEDEEERDERGNDWAAARSHRRAKLPSVS